LRFAVQPPPEPLDAAALLAGVDRSRWKVIDRGVLPVVIEYHDGDPDIANPS